MIEIFVQNKGESYQSFKTRVNKWIENNHMTTPELEFVGTNKDGMLILLFGYAPID